MAEFWYVAPAAQSLDPLPAPSFDPGSEFAGPYAGGDSIRLPNGLNTTAAHNPSVNLYEGASANNPAPGNPIYYILGETLHYRDNADPTLIRVERVNTWAQVPIEEAYTIQQGNLDRQADAVNYNAIDAGDPNWAWVLTVQARLPITDVNEGLQDRLKDITVDGAQKLYWPDGFTTNIIIQHKTFGTKKLRQITTDVGATGWGALMKAKGLHGEQSRDASFAVSEDLDAAFDANGQGGWDALVGIDVASPEYNWPPYWLVT